jgi:hypothetical protein
MKMRYLIAAVAMLSAGLSGQPSAAQQAATAEEHDHRAALSVIRKINDNFAVLADGKRVRYLNITDKLG